MYCRNCGNEIKDGVIFCEECGYQVKEIKKEPLINYKELSKKYKKHLIGMCTVLVILVVYLFLNNIYFSETAVLRRYVIANARGNYNLVINLSGIEKNEFITNKNIKIKYGSRRINIVEITNVTTNKTEGEHTRTVTYQVGDYTANMNLSIKKNGRKYLIFNNYIVTSTDLVAKNVELTVPTNSILIVDNVKLTDKYKTTSTSNTTTYKIDSLLKKNVKITLKFSNGLTLTDTKSVFNNENINYTKLNYTDIDSTSKAKLVDIVNKSVEEIVTNALSKSDTKITESNLYTDNLKKSTTFTDNYNVLVDKYSIHNITEFKLTDISIDNINLDDTNNINLKSTITYTYKDSNSKIHERKRVVNLLLNKNLLIDEFYLTTLTNMF